MKTKTTVAKSSDGTIQITLTLPWSKIKKTREIVTTDLVSSVVVPGFRKGKAPRDKAIEHISKEKVLEKTLNKILPKLYGEILKKEKLTTAMFPKFELISAKDGEDWQVRAITAQMPIIDLKDYKEKIKGEARAGKIWTPDKGKSKETQEATPEEKEQKVIKLLLNSVSLDIPKVLVEEEVNQRLANLLQRIEKLGINLDNYLTSIGKNPETLRKEYGLQAEQNIRLDMILGKIATEEDIKVLNSEIDVFIKASGNDKKFESPEQKNAVAAVLRKRKVIQNLISLL